MASENLFSALEKYTGENYLTETFVYLIKYLLEADRALGIEILTKLCATGSKILFADYEPITLTTQETIEKGILDIRVASANKEIYIEVKDNAIVDPEQLQKYKDFLQKTGAQYKVLVLLTRYSVDYEDHYSIPDKFIRWNEVHGWIRNLKSKDLISSYLINSFKMFLEGKQMSINKVTWEYERGVLALNNLMQMIEESIIAVPARISRGGGRGKGYTGFYFEGGEFWCGIYNFEPLSIKFEIQYPNRFDRSKLKGSIESMHESNGILYLELQLEEIHFFSLDAEKQKEEISKFVKNSYTYLQKVKK